MSYVKCLLLDADQFPFIKRTQLLNWITDDWIQVNLIKIHFCHSICNILTRLACSR